VPGRRKRGTKPQNDHPRAHRERPPHRRRLSTSCAGPHDRDPARSRALAQRVRSLAATAQTNKPQAAHTTHGATDCRPWGISPPEATHWPHTSAWVYPELQGTGRKTAGDANRPVVRTLRSQGAFMLRDDATSRTVLPPFHREHVGPGRQFYRAVLVRRSPPCPSTPRKICSSIASFANT
jgi:hypothetical protein